MFHCGKIDKAVDTVNLVIKRSYMVEKRGKCAIMKRKREGWRMSDTKIQWHSGFVAAMSLEFEDNREGLIFEKEYNLNTSPLEIDLLVIKKDLGVQMVNEIGKLFRGHNIVEYKSPEDHMNIDTFYKAGAYGCLYKAYGESVNERPADDITISIIRDTRPEGLFRYFKEHKIRVTNPYEGIYYILDEVLFQTQIIVGRELRQKEHTWIKALSDRVQKQEMRELLERVHGLTQKYDRELADSVLEVSIGANWEIVEELRGDDSMCKALLELMEPEINKIVELELQKERQKESRKSIVNAVKSFRDLGADNKRIQEILVKNYELTPEEATLYL